jgi:hypothetical protein
MRTVFNAWLPPYSRHNPGHLTALSVLRSREPVDGLRGFLLQSHGLRTLELDFLYSAAQGDSLNLIDLGGNLLPLCETLVHLVLRFDMFREGKHGLNFLEDIVEGDLTFLWSFTALVSLETSLGLLFGEDVHNLRDCDDLTHNLADVLPHNLRKLNITDDLWAMEHFISSEEKMTMSTF